MCISELCFASIKNLPMTASDDAFPDTGGVAGIWVSSVIALQSSLIAKMLLACIPVTLA